jgi:hypothetical protein
MPPATVCRCAEQINNRLLIPVGVKMPRHFEKPLVNA